jgi:hypothetical protein
LQPGRIAAVLACVDGGRWMAQVEHSVSLPMRAWVGGLRPRSTRLTPMTGGATCRSACCSP